MIAFVIQDHPDRTCANLRCEFVRCLTHYRPFLSGVRASGNPGAVHTFIVGRVVAGDRLAPFDQLIGAWWTNLKWGGVPNGVRGAVLLPKRIRAADLQRSHIDLYSVAAIHHFARRSDNMLETEWAVPLRSVAAALFDAEDIDEAVARLVLDRLVKRVALSAEEAQELRRLQSFAVPAKVPATATVLLEDLRIPFLDNRQFGWAAYIDGRIPVIGEGEALKW